MVWFLIFVLWPLAELFVIVKISEAIGFIWMLLLLIISWPVGSRILRSQGRVAWRQFVDAVQAGRPPANEVLNGALVLSGGLLLMVPGFITDVIGLLLLLPPTRALARSLVARHHGNVWVGRAASFGSTGFFGNRRNSGSNGPDAHRDYDADSTAVDIDSQELNP
jgi:UPF0716 protein FxsA